MDSVDPAFKSIERNKPCFMIWRIESMNVVAVPKPEYGTFFKGDSYIVLSVAPEGGRRNMSKQIVEKKGTLDSHIHFWLGKETTQDEAGVAAYKSVELDDFLGGAPVQHREVEEHESKLFLSYFKGSIKYKKGGVKSGFTHVDTTIQTRLLQVKGKHSVRVQEVDIDWSSFNSGDVFILDQGKMIFVWQGKDCSRTEKLKGFEQARVYRDDRGSANIIDVAEGEEDAMTDNEKALWNKYLPLSEKKIKSKEEGGTDESAEKAAFGGLKLYCCSDEDGTLKVSEVKSGPLEKSDLHSGDSFIIQNGDKAIWTWIGKQSSKKEKSEAMRNALGFIKKKGLPNNVNVTRVVEGGEPPDFICLFKKWPKPVATGKVYKNNKIAKTIQTKFDASTLHSNRALAAETQMVDDGSGTTEVWRVKDFDLEPVDMLKHKGQFFGGDCYVIKYTYLLNNKENWIIYYWIGAKSSVDEQGTAALKTVEMDDALGGAPVQVRVEMGKEPAHLLSIFDGKMIIFSGGHAGKFGGSDGSSGGPGDSYMLQVRGTSELNTKSIQVPLEAASLNLNYVLVGGHAGKFGGSDGSSGGPGDSYMLQVRGTSELNTKSIQVPLEAASLNSNDVFVVFTKKQTFIWYGKGATGDERECAKKVAALSPREPINCFETQEPKTFWEAIGGKGEYFSDKRLQDDNSDRPVRLFQISNASGNMKCEEIVEFQQSDLVTDDCMMLDAWDTIFVWIGADARPEEKKGAEQIAFEYLKSDPADRDPKTPVCRVKQGFEPATFTGFFGPWDYDFFKKTKDYKQFSKELAAQNNEVIVIKEQAADADNNFDALTKYSLSDLQQAVDELPNGVDPSMREMYLSADDFKATFNMNYSEFMNLAKWKQQKLKKDKKLF